MSDDNITVVSAEEAREMEDYTDYEALQQMTDEDIERAVAGDPDAVLLDEEWFRNATVAGGLSGKRHFTSKQEGGVTSTFDQEEGNRKKFNVSVE